MEPALTSAARDLLDQYLRLPDACHTPAPMSLPESARGLLDAFPAAAQPPDGEVFVAVEDAPVGAVHIVRHAPHAARLERMFVRPQARRQGVGDALLSAAVSTASTLGYSQLVLDVIAERTSAIRLYRRTGFVDVDAYADYGRPMKFLGRSLDEP